MFGKVLVGLFLSKLRGESLNQVRSHKSAKQKRDFSSRSISGRVRKRIKKKQILSLEEQVVKFHSDLVLCLVQTKRSQLDALENLFTTSIEKGQFRNILLQLGNKKELSDLTLSRFILLLEMVFLIGKTRTTEAQSRLKIEEFVKENKSIIAHFLFRFLEEPKLLCQLVPVLYSAIFYEDFSLFVLENYIDQILKLKVSKHKKEELYFILKLLYIIFYTKEKVFQEIISVHFFIQAESSRGQSELGNKLYNF
eukprot:snap_masked-scaffold_8-processed-gene-10.31-mRNA-1 protein AED:1.00 eAED:1.00 QI:0/0/0/0/1/1/3/0/251